MKISVAMATYNGEKYIREQLDSILQQLHVDDEMIISDDGSSDATVRIIEEYKSKDERICLLDGPHNGLMANFENALKHCSGDLIFLADQDDVWSENKVHLVLEQFENPNTHLVLHDACVMNEDLSEVLMPSFFEYRGSKPGVWHSFIKNSYMGCCMAFRRELVEKILPIPLELPMHDQWIGLISDYYYGKSVMLGEQLLLYRRHEKAASDFGHNSVPIMIRNRIMIYQALRKRTQQLRKEIRRNE